MIECSGLSLIVGVKSQEITTRSTNPVERIFRPDNNENSHDHDDDEHSHDHEEEHEDNHGEDHLEEGSVDYLTWLQASLAVVLISLCGVFGVVIIPIMQKLFYQHLLQFLIALGTLPLLILPISRYLISCGDSCWRRSPPPAPSCSPASPRTC